VFRIGDVVSFVPIVQMNLCFVKRRDSDSHEAARFLWIVPPESFCDIAPRRSTRVPDLFAISAIVERGALGSKCKDFVL